jgi:hypothetical protein
MAIKVACVCGKELSVKDEHAGKRVKCPACQKPLRIPSPKVEEESLDDECDTGDEWDTGDEQVEAPVTSRRAKPSSASGSVSRTRKGQGKGKKSSGSNRGLLIGLSAGAGVLVVAVLVWVLWPDPGEDNVAANPSRTEAETANSPDGKDLLTNTIGMRFVPIPPGTFTMGEGEKAHQVTLTQPFELGVYEVT